MTGAVAWGEWTKSSGLYSEVTLLWDGEKYVGRYRSNMDMSGTLVLKKRDVFHTITAVHQWAVLENADFRANDLVAFVRNVVLRIVGQSSAMQRLGG